MLTDFDKAYDIRAAVADSAALLAAHTETAAAFRAGADARLDVPYGVEGRERLDLFLPQGAPAGLVVFVHGGYWRAMGKADFSHMAAGAVARGWAVAVPGYPLCPAVRIAAITRSVARAVAVAAAAIPGPVVLSGHSAGGHLATRMVCADSPLLPEAAARVVRVVAISGVFDLRPLLRTAMNETLRLDLPEARAESPLLAEPRPGTRLTAWVGGAELPEFLRQTTAMASVWAGLGAWTEAVEAPGLHHFDVIDALADPGSALVARLVGADAAA
jgi:acetyl esterase/lipase